MNNIDVAKIIYDILNVNELTSLLTGKVYLFNKPTDSKLTDIVIKPNYSKGNGIIESLFYINVFCKELTTDIYNVNKLNTIITKVKELISNNIVRLNFLIDLESINEIGILPDLHDTQMNFYTISYKSYTIK